jgi:hypothetical protein
MTEETITQQPGFYVVNTYRMAAVAGPFEALGFDVDKALFEAGQSGDAQPGHIGLRHFDGTNWNKVDL